MSKPARPDSIAQADWDAVDSPPLGEEILSRMRPVAEVAPELIQMARPRAHPLITNPKIDVNIRLSADILERFRATGADWQSRNRRDFA